MARSVIVPCVHLNGTSKQSLMDALEEAYTAVGDAMDKLRRTAPNGRDYYVYDNAAYGRAADEHGARMAKLQDIRDEIEAIVGGIEHGHKEAIVTE